MKNLLKIQAMALIIILTLSYTNISIATNKQDLQNEKSNLTNAISEAKDDLEDIKEEKSETLSQVETLMSQIADYQEEIDELNSQIATLQKQIQDKTKKIKEDEEKYKANQEAMNQRLIAMYEYGEKSYLDVVFSSSNLTDLISNYYMVSELATYDTDMLKQIEEEKQKIENEKQELENSKLSLDSAKNAKTAKASALSVVKKEKEQKASKLSEEEQKAQQEIQEMLEDKAQIEKQLKKIAEEEAAAAAKAAAEKNKKNSQNNSVTINTGSPSSAGFIFPVSGCSLSSITNKSYPSYAGHTGVDVNIGVIGKSVVAVKDGTVVISTALKNSSGGYRSYGEYVIINHGDGIMTLYAHMLSGSRTVTAGQKVKQGQVLGTVGSTGNSTRNTFTL